MSGTSSAVESVGIQGDLAGGAGETQPELFAADRPAVEPVDVAERRGRGRPPGAQNKTTREMIEFIQHNHGDPRLWLARVMATPLKQLAREIGKKRGDAADFQQRAVVALLPYMAGKPAVEIDVTRKETKLVFAVAMDGDRAGAAGGASASMLALFEQHRADAERAAIGEAVEDAINSET